MTGTTEILAIALVTCVAYAIGYCMGHNKGWNDADRYSENVYEMYKKVHDYIMENRRAKKQAKR